MQIFQRFVIVILFWDLKFLSPFSDAIEPELGLLHYSALFVNNNDRDATNNEATSFDMRSEQGFPPCKVPVALIEIILFTSGTKHLSTIYICAHLEDNNIVLQQWDNTCGPLLN